MELVDQEARSGRTTSSAPDAVMCLGRAHRIPIERDRLSVPCTPVRSCRNPRERTIAHADSLITLEEEEEGGV